MFVPAGRVAKDEALIVHRPGVAVPVARAGGQRGRRKAGTQQLGVGHAHQSRAALQSGVLENGGRTGSTVPLTINGMLIQGSPMLGKSGPMRRYPSAMAAAGSW
jgi:hypothetical protein